jgi:sugar O-acyltransferase (sialic acid O-acetyltransferase NeuD family)
VNPRRLLLIGAGGLAREVLAAARSLPDEWTPVGCLDDNAARHGSTVDGVPVLGPTALVHEYPDAAVLICVANAARPTARPTLARRLSLAADRYGVLVHPAASVASGVELGAGTILLAGAVVTAPQRVGAHVLLMPQCVLTHDDAVGDGVTMATRAALAGGVTVGESAYLGAGALIRENLSIGAGAVIGMGAVVLADVPAGETWAGVPAQRMERKVGTAR